MRHSSIAPKVPPEKLDRELKKAFTSLWPRLQPLRVKEGSLVESIAGAELEAALTLWRWPHTIQPSLSYLITTRRTSETRQCTCVFLSPMLTAGELKTRSEGLQEGAYTRL